MRKINYLSIGGFRRLYALNVEMRPLMVLIGPNGTGKTSFLDALNLLAASADGRLSKALSDMGGISSISTFGSTDNLAITTTATTGEHADLEYSFSIASRGAVYEIASETLREGEKKHIDAGAHVGTILAGDVHYFDPRTQAVSHPTWEYDRHETALSQAPRAYPHPNALRDILKSVSHYHALDVGRNAPIKLPQQMEPVLHPGENGENLFSFLYNLREMHPERYESIEDTMRAAFPGFESLGFPPVAAGMLFMTWKEKFFKNLIYANQLSEGTLRFLWLTSLLQSPVSGALVLIDEPEVSLHPEMLSLLADLLREASQRMQIVVATHSDRLVRFMRPDEVAVMDMDDDGHSTLHWADSLNLNEWLKDYSLDELWQMGTLKG